MYYFSFYLYLYTRNNKNHKMKRENLHQPFEICFSELDESQLKEHDHTFLNWSIFYREQVFSG